MSSKHTTRRYTALIKLVGPIYPPKEVALLPIQIKKVVFGLRNELIYHLLIPHYFYLVYGIE
jgi:hypothetical protein